MRPGGGGRRPRRRRGMSATATTMMQTARTASRTCSALRLDRDRPEELLVLRRQFRGEGATALGAGKEDARVGPALENLLHGIARGLGRRQRRLDGLHELLHEHVDVAFLRHGTLRYHTAPMTSWTPLGSTVRYTRDKLALRE